MYTLWIHIHIYVYVNLSILNIILNTDLCFNSGSVINSWMLLRNTFNHLKFVSPPELAIEIHLSARVVVNFNMGNMYKTIIPHR